MPSDVLAVRIRDVRSSRAGKRPEREPPGGEHVIMKEFVGGESVTVPMPHGQRPCLMGQVAQMPGGDR